MIEIASTKTAVTFVTVTEEQESQRIDNFLLKHLKGVPKSRIYRLLRKGEVRVNKKRIKAMYKLELDDVIRIPPVRVAEREHDDPSEYNKKQLQQSIIYEDDALIVINKPSGMAVHGGSGIAFGVIEIFRALRPQAKSLELVHRIDRETSGCLLIAKKRSVLKALHEQLREGKVDKRYLALLRGHWQGGARKVNVSLDKGQVNEAGKEALTEFTPQQKFATATLMAVKLYTGRTHQIRAHAAYLACPVAGDDKYGEREFNRAMKKLGLKRLFLHAKSLKFKHPVTEELLEINADLTPELQDVLNNAAL